MSRTIAILGAGYAGALTAVQLLRQCVARGTRVVLVERTAFFARGLAYRSWDESQLLNVPAGNMSALAQDSAHFTEYCKRIDPALNAGSFVSRRIYGDYLEDTLHDARRKAAAALELIRGEAIAVRRDGPTGRFAVEMAGGERLPADQVVLALGHFPPADPLPGMREELGEAYLPDPWDMAALDRCDRSRPAVLIGSGHTAVDVLVRLANRGDAGGFVLLSRHGLLPHGHRPTPHAPAFGPSPAYLEGAIEQGTLRALLRAVRSQAEQRLQSGGDWRDVINEMRPHIPRIWERLPIPERARFFRRVAPFWDVHRHRLAPSVHQRLQRMQRTGQIQQVAARLLRCERDAGGARLTIRERRSGEVRALAAGTVVNCTGPVFDLRRVQLPLFRQLHADGLLRPDALGLGIDIDERYQVVDAQGRCVPGLHYIGPMLKATFWEAIAVPELRGHAHQLARCLLDADRAARAA